MLRLCIFAAVLGTIFGSEETVQSFGFLTFHSKGDTTNLTVILFWDDMIYECDHAGLEAGTTYMCTSDDWVSCEAETGDRYEIMVDNTDNTDSLIVEHFFVRTADAYFGIHGACYATAEIPPSSVPYATNSTECADGEEHFETFCVDDEEGDCTPAKQIWEFDTTRQGINITDAAFRTGEDETGEGVCSDMTSAVNMAHIGYILFASMAYAMHSAP